MDNERKQLPTMHKTFYQKESNRFLEISHVLWICLFCLNPGFRYHYQQDSVSFFRFVVVISILILTKS